MTGWSLAHWQDGRHKSKEGTKKDTGFLSETTDLKGTQLKKEQRDFFFSSRFKIVVAINILE